MISIKQNGICSGGPHLTVADNLYADVRYLAYNPTNNVTIINLENKTNINNVSIWNLSEYLSVFKTKPKESFILYTNFESLKSTCVS